MKDPVLLKIMRTSYAARIDILVEEVRIFTERMIGIGEHIDYCAPIENKLDEISKLQDRIEAINYIIGID